MTARTSLLVTVALGWILIMVVFTLTAPDQFDQLMYDDGEGSAITLWLKP